MPFRPDERAVDSVVGTILLVGITVTTFSAVGLLVLAEFDEAQETFSADIVLESTGRSLVLQLRGGDPIDADGASLRVDLGGNVSNHPLRDLNGLWTDPDTWTLGDPVCVAGTASACLFSASQAGDVDGILVIAANTVLLQDGSFAGQGGASGSGGSPGLDGDGDGIPDLIDNCPSVSNVSQLDTDLDGQGNACDTDDDGDGVLDGVDNCPLIANANQLDTDMDGTGDACDLTPNGPDSDGDGVADADDKCPGIVGTDEHGCLPLVGLGIGGACEDLNDNGVCDSGDSLIAVDLDNTYGDSFDLIIPEESGPLSANQVDLEAGTIIIEVNITSNSEDLDIKATKGNLTMEGVTVTAASGKKLELEAEDGGSLFLSNITLIGESDVLIEADNAGGCDEGDSNIVLHDAVIDVANGRLDLDIDCDDGAILAQRITVNVGGDIHFDADNREGSYVDLRNAIEIHAEDGAIITVSAEEYMLLQGAILQADADDDLRLDVDDDDSGAEVFLDGASFKDEDNSNGIEATLTGAIEAGDVDGTLALGSYA